MINEQILSIPEDQFKLLKKLVKRSNEINGYKANDLIFCSYGFVKMELPDLLTEGKFEQLIRKMIYVKGEMTIQNTMPFIFWILDELKKITEIEQEYLSSQPEIDMIAAGIERLNELGETNLIDSLAGGDILKWERIKKLPYHVIFDKQRKMKLEADIQRELARIQKAKSKK